MTTINIIGKLMIFIAMVGIYSCNQNIKTSKEAMEESSKQQEKNKETNKSLLEGVSKAVCYSGFRSGQHPDRGDGAVNPSYNEVLEDMQIIRDTLGFKLIRVYDCGENTEMILKVIDDNKIDVKVMLGIWLRAELSAHETCAWLNEPIPQHELDSNKVLNKKEIQKGIELANRYSHIISAVNVGNEALVDWNDHKVDVDSIISYVKKVQSMIDQEVTVADNYDWWANSGKELADVVDFVSIHIYPVWEGKGIDEAMSYSIQNIQKVADSLVGKRLVITEAGWATTASEFGERASEENQLIYYRELMNFAHENNITTFWFEAFDEDWKGNKDNPIGAEKHWGLYTVDRMPKEVVKYIKDNK